MHLKMVNEINYPGVLRLQSDGKMLEKPLFYEAKLNPNKHLWLLCRLP